MKAPIVTVSLAFALLASFVAYMDDTSQQPFSDPWFMPVIFVLLWQSIKN